MAYGRLAPSAMNDRKKIGIGLTFFGILFTFLGVVFFFDKGLLAMGNILFLAGVALTIGLRPTVTFFLKRNHRKGSAFFLSGFLLVLIGWAFVGMLIQAYGFVLLFRGFLPTVMIFMHRVPGMSWFLALPFVRQVLGRFQETRLPP